MSPTKNAILTLGARQGSAPITEPASSVAAAQAGATRVNGAICRVKLAVATGSFILPSIGSGEAMTAMTVVNDTAVAINVYPAVGEKMNGSANTALSVASGASGVFFPVLNSVLNYPTTLDWRAAVVS